MTVIYGPINLGNIISTQELSRQPIYHGPNYILSKTVLKIRSTINPFTCSFVYLPGGAGIRVVDPPISAAGRTALETDIAIRHRLMQPRQKLIFSTDSGLFGRLPAVILIAPMPLPLGDGLTQFYVVDALNGPFPLEYRIVKRHADKTLEIEWTVMVHINECDLFVTGSQTNTSVMLSNLFKMTRVTDQDHFSTRTIEGEAVFRTDELIRRGAKADDFVGYLSFPVPVNMQRVEVQTYPSEDGSRCSYRIVDKEKPFNLLTNYYNVTRLEVYHTVGVNWIGAEYSVLAGAKAAASMAAKAGSLDVWGGELASGGLATAVELANVTAHFALVAAELADTIAPHFMTGIVVRVWGNRNATRNGLAVVAAVIGAKFITGEQLFWSQHDIQIGEDAVGKFVELKVSLKMGPGRSIYQLGLGFTLNMTRFIDKNDDIPQVTTSLAVANPVPPNDSAMRGTFVGALVSAQLLAPCGIPQKNTVETVPPRFTSFEPT